MHDRSLTWSAGLYSLYRFLFCVYNYSTYILFIGSIEIYAAENDVIPCEEESDTLCCVWLVCKIIYDSIRDGRAVLWVMEMYGIARSECLRTSRMKCLILSVIDGWMRHNLLFYVWNVCMYFLGSTLYPVCLEIVKPLKETSNSMGDDFKWQSWRLHINEKGHFQHRVCNGNIHLFGFYRRHINAYIKINTRGEHINMIDVRDPQTTAWQDYMVVDVQLEIELAQTQFVKKERKKENSTIIFHIQQTRTHQQSTNDMLCVSKVPSSSSSSSWNLIVSTDYLWIECVCAWYLIFFLFCWRFIGKACAMSEPYGWWE